jgi:hypothetical protein
VAAAKKKRVPPFAPVRVKPKRAGALTIKLKLSKSTARTLRRRGSLKLRIALTFRPTGGKRAVSSQTVTLTQPCPKPRPKRRPTLACQRPS